MNEVDIEPLLCYNCDAEFTVHTIYETDVDVCFCPYCGSEIEGTEEDFIDEEDEEDDLFK